MKRFGHVVLGLLVVEVVAVVSYFDLLWWLRGR